MKDNYERLRKEYLNICDEDCGGDPSTGIQPCPFFEYEEGCLLKSEKFRAAPGELNNLAAAVHENAVAHGWWEQEREYAAYFAPEVEDGSGGAACGVTTFPEDGSPPVVEVSGEIPIAAGVEIFAHELAHVATPEDREHGEAWKTAFDRILEEYNRIAQDLFGEGGEEPC